MRIVLTIDDKKLAGITKLTLMSYIKMALLGHGQCLVHDHLLRGGLDVQINVLCDDNLLREDHEFIDVSDEGFNHE